VSRLHDALMAPRSVAIVGASDDRAKTTARPLAFLQDVGWEGHVYPVNPTRETVLGARAYPSVTALPETPDHVYVLAATDKVVGIVDECVARDVPLVTIMADGFVAADPRGNARIEALKTAIDGSRTRVLGPSSLGVANVNSGFLLTANAAFARRDLEAGGMFVATQSGSAMGALLSRSRQMRVGVAGLVSTGGELDLSLGEICESVLDDPEVTSFALFLENLNGADDLRRFALAAADRGKPIVAFKLGRSDEAAELAVSHTGALAGDDAVASAFFQDLGIARTNVFEALLEAQQLAVVTPVLDAPPRAPRVAVLSTTGGGGAMMIDCLVAAGAEPTAPSDETIERLEAEGINVGHGTLIDVTLAGTRYEVMKAALDVLCTAPEFDVVMVVPGSSAEFNPEIAVKPIVDSSHHGTPLATFVMPNAPQALKLLRESGVAAFRTPESAADAIVAVLSRRAPAARDAIAGRPSSQEDILDEVTSAELLGRVGIAFAPSAVVAVDDIPSELPVPGPAAVKVLSARIPHKSDAGGVRLGVADGEQLRDAVSEITASVGEHVPGVTVERVLVQQMVRGVAEVLLGYEDDASVGPVVMLAAGGVLAELFKDRALRVAPVDLSEAHAMISEVVALKAVAGYRGLPEGDLDALAHAIVAMSRLGEETGRAVLEAEANPMMILPAGQGVVAVDALVRVNGTVS
jgi:acyl-CoA synthetase (NDP forming)